MKIEWLHYFVVLAETRSFHLAANRLCVSQQALSKHLASLEEKLGCQLVLRSKRFEHLTPAGEMLLYKAQAILNKAQKLESAALPPATAESLRIRLAVDPVLLPALSQLLQNFQTQSSLPEGASLDFEVYTQLSVEEIPLALAQARLDLAILPQGQASAQLNAQLFAQSEQAIFMPAEQSAQHWQELSFVKVVSEGGWVEDLWPEQDWPRKVVAEADLTTALRLCEQGLGALCLPAYLTRSYHKRQLKLGPKVPFQLVSSLLLIPSAALAHSPLKLEFMHYLQAYGKAYTPN